MSRKKSPNPINMTPRSNNIEENEPREGKQSISKIVLLNAAYYPFCCKYTSEMQSTYKLN